MKKKVRKVFSVVHGPEPKPSMLSAAETPVLGLPGSHAAGNSHADVQNLVWVRV